MDAKALRVRLTAGQLEKGKFLCLRCASTATGDGQSAREELQRVSYLKFLEWLVPGEPRHLRSGSGLATRSGVMAELRRGSRSGGRPIKVADDVTNDMTWRRQALGGSLAGRQALGVTNDMLSSLVRAAALRGAPGWRT